MDVLYIDELFALNLLTDYLLLLSAARLRGTVLRRGRCFLAALFGAAYAALSVLPGLLWLQSGAAKLACSGLMVLLAYGGEKRLLRAWAALLAVSAAFAGAVAAAVPMAGDRSAAPGLLLVSGRTLLLSFGLFYALLRLFLDRIGEHRQRQRMEAAVALEGRTCSFPVLLDTGNTLRDAVTLRRVLIAERAALAPLFPAGLPDTTDAPGAMRLLGGSGGDLPRRLRLVPYGSVGGSGLLLCFAPDALTLDGEETDALIGIAPQSFGGEYGGIIGKE